MQHSPLTPQSTPPSTSRGVVTPPTSREVPVANPPAEESPLEVVSTLH